MKFLPPTASLFRPALTALAAALWLAAAGLPALTTQPAQAQLALPSLGDGTEMTTSQERRLGDRIIRSLYNDPDYLDDPVLHAYVMEIWNPLVKSAEQRGDISEELSERFAWEVLLGRDRSINAFALPGGYLGLHLGLIGVVNTRDELASVLAHELSHVSQRHIARMMVQDKKSTPIMIASLILGVLAASKSPDAAMALMVGGQAAAIQNQLSFSRDMEREADRIGHGLMAPSGFAPQGSVSMFEKLQHASRLNDNGSWPYLRSHPLTSERIADMQSRVSHDSRAPAVPTLEHALLSARARVLTRPGPDRLRQWIQLPQTAEFAALPANEQAAQLYAAALSQLELRDAAAARQSWSQLQRLLRSLPAASKDQAAGLRQMLWLGAEIELAAGQPDAALALLNDPGAAVPAAQNAAGPRSEAQRPALLLRAQAQLALREPAAVSSALQGWVAEHPNDATAWRLLSQAWSAQNQPLRALRAEAEAQVAHYDYAAAVDRFRAAQDWVRNHPAQVDHIEASIVDTRLRAVQALLKEQVDEK